MDDHRFFAAKRHQRRGERCHPPLLGYTKKARLGVCWVNERSEKVKNRSNADLLAWLEDGTHCRMEPGREHEPDADLLNGIFDLFWRLRQVHAETFQHISTAAVAGNRSVAVFCYYNSSPGRD